MKIFNLDSIEVFPYKDRDKNVFFNSKEFKTRIISLSAGEHIPECEMASYVVFIVIEGEVNVKVNGYEAKLSKNQCLITEPALISMSSINGARIVGIQISKNL